MKLNKSSFESFNKQAKHQFILKDGKYIYFICPGSDPFHTNDSFIAKNENTGAVEIVDYKKIKSVVVDGKETIVND